MKSICMIIYVCDFHLSVVSLVYGIMVCACIALQYYSVLSFSTSSLIFFRIHPNLYCFIAQLGLFDDCISYMYYMYASKHQILERWNTSDKPTLLYIFELCKWWISSSNFTSLCIWDLTATFFGMTVFSPQYDTPTLSADVTHNNFRRYWNWNWQLPNDEPNV